MTIKQALICNLLSSILCLIGVLIGLAIGGAHETAPWIFASTAGMFIYIALVDMVFTFSLSSHLLPDSKWLTLDRSSSRSDARAERAHGDDRVCCTGAAVHPTGRPLKWFLHHAGHRSLWGPIHSHISTLVRPRLLQFWFSPPPISPLYPLSSRLFSATGLNPMPTPTLITRTSVSSD